MPKASINENRYFFCPENEIGPTNQFLVTTPTGDASHFKDFN
jgi:hypothetical protein